MILNNADEGVQVKFLSWGPHMTREELLDLAKEAGVTDLASLIPQIKWLSQTTGTEESARAIVRVQFEMRGGELLFRGAPQTASKDQWEAYDCLLLVLGKRDISIGREKKSDKALDDGFVATRGTFETGDNWKQE